MTYKHLTIEEATAFFSEFYRGQHHIPGKIHPFGNGFQVKHPYGGFSTFDGNDLTRLVLLAHHYCIRATVSPISFRYLGVDIFKRQGREGNISVRHPDIQTAISNFTPLNESEV